jgi:hypothetical protein
MTSNLLTPNISIVDTVQLIKEKIETKTPFALTRFGDGEIYVLKKSYSKEFLESRCKMWGYNYPEESDDFVNDASTIIKKAFVESDVIGIMDPNTKVVKIFYNGNLWSIERERAEQLGRNLDDIKICDHMISRSFELGNIDSMKNILNGHSVNIITPNTELLIPKQLEKRLETEVGFTHHSTDVNFRNRDEFLKSFEKIKEDVVLFGVGLQKDYGVILRDEFGKIAIDMGATMDAWSGIISRPWFNKGQSQEHLLVEDNT